MGRHCVSIRLDDGTTVNMQFGHKPTEAEIERAKKGLEADVAAIKSGTPPAPPEPQYPD